ncbi:MAG: hypothetical protein JXR15_12645 [Shimia sp.]|uniref:hypothetical protein n=1 Tax=Shimia sp. TaxID=1954381 RepID=UPI003B8BCBEC
MIEESYTYAGLLDDVLARCEPAYKADDRYFQKVLLRSVFFGSRLLINDGYIFYGSGLDQATKQNSLLRELNRNGHALLLSKLPEFDPDAFARLPEKLAGDGVNTSRRVVTSPEWPEQKESLRRWGETIRSYGSWRRFPPYQMHIGFQKIFERLAEKSPVDFGLTGVSKEGFSALLEDFRKHPDYALSPRGAIEEVLREIVVSKDGFRDQRSQILKIACQAYHYNFGMALTSSLGEPVVSETFIGLAFDELLELSDPVDTELLEFPVVSIPNGLPLDQPRLFMDFVIPDTDAHEAKTNYLENLNQSLDVALTNSESARSMISEASTEYRKFIAGHFAREGISIDARLEQYGPLVSFGLKPVLGGLAVVGDLALAVSKAAKISVAANFIEGINKKAFNAILNPNNKVGNVVPRDQIAVREIAPRFAKIAFNRPAADAHVADLPKFN